MYSETTLLLCTPSCKLEHEGQRHWQLRNNIKPKKKKIPAPTGTQNAGRGCAIRVHRRHFSIPDVSSVVQLVPAYLSRSCLALLLLISTSGTVAGAIAHAAA